jgi:Restriction endonuclease
MSIINSTATKVLLALVVLYSLPRLIVLLLSQYPVTGGLGLAVGLLALYYFAFEKPARRKFGKALDAIINRHLEVLKRAYVILVQHDNQGNPILAKWHNYVNGFLSNVARPGMRLGMRRRLDESWGISVQRVTDWTVAALNVKPADMPFANNITPAEYEAFCANELRGAGWTVYQTRLSGDQGVDLIAEKNGMRAALQCKLYTNPVGNRAVQEIVAGKAHRRARYGVVVSNNRYTPSAVSLARSNRIHLLHHTDLANLERILSGGSGRDGLFAA